LRETELSIDVVLDQAALHQGNQITIVFGYYEAYRATTPAVISLELSKVSAMIFVVRIKGH
jgi:hypothetical protein